MFRNLRTTIDHCNLTILKPRRRTSGIRVYTRVLGTLSLNSVNPKPFNPYTNPISHNCAVSANLRPEKLVQHWRGPLRLAVFFSSASDVHIEGFFRSLLAAVALEVTARPSSGEDSPMCKLFSV